MYLTITLLCALVLNTQATNTQGQKNFQNAPIFAGPNQALAHSNRALNGNNFDRFGQGNIYENINNQQYQDNFFKEGSLQDEFDTIFGSHNGFDHNQGYPAQNNRPEFLPPVGYPNAFYPPFYPPHYYSQPNFGLPLPPLTYNYHQQPPGSNTNVASSAVSGSGSSTLNKNPQKSSSTILTGYPFQYYPSYYPPPEALGQNYSPLKPSIPFNSGFAGPSNIVKKYIPTSLPVLPSNSANVISSAVAGSSPEQIKSAIESSLSKIFRKHNPAPSPAQPGTSNPDITITDLARAPPASNIENKILRTPNVINNNVNSASPISSKTSTQISSAITSSLSSILGNLNPVAAPTQQGTANFVKILRSPDVVNNNVNSNSGSSVIVSSIKTKDATTLGSNPQPSTLVPLSNVPASPNNGVTNNNDVIDKTQTSSEITYSESNDINKETIPPTTVLDDSTNSPSGTSSPIDSVTPSSPIPPVLPDDSDNTKNGPPDSSLIVTNSPTPDLESNVFENSQTPTADVTPSPTTDEDTTPASISSNPINTSPTDDGSSGLDEAVTISLPSDIPRNNNPTPTSVLPKNSTNCKTDTTASDVDSVTTSSPTYTDENTTPAAATNSRGDSSSSPTESSEPNKTVTTSLPPNTPGYTIEPNPPAFPPRKDGTLTPPPDSPEDSENSDSDTTASDSATETNSVTTSSPISQSTTAAATNNPANTSSGPTSSTSSGQSKAVTPRLPPYTRRYTIGPFPPAPILRRNNIPTPPPDSLEDSENNESGSTASDASSQTNSVTTSSPISQSTTAAATNNPANTSSGPTSKVSSVTTSLLSSTPGYKVQPIPPAFPPRKNGILTPPTDSPEDSENSESGTTASDTPTQSTSSPTYTVENTTPPSEDDTSSSPSSVSSGDLSGDDDSGPSTLNPPGNNNPPLSTVTESNNGLTTSAPTAPSNSVTISPISASENNNGVPPSAPNNPANSPTSLSNTGIFPSKSNSLIQVKPDGIISTNLDLLTIASDNLPQFDSKDLEGAYQTSFGVSVPTSENTPTKILMKLSYNLPELYPSTKSETNSQSGLASGPRGSPTPPAISSKNCGSTKPAPIESNPSGPVCLCFKNYKLMPEYIKKIILPIYM